jgi:ABC-type multidrug transport system ATPase subunit
VIAGAIEASEGSLQYQTENNRTETGVASNRNGQTVGKDIFRQISISAPYLELVEELTAVEFLSFHARFKPLINGQDIKSILNSTGLETAIDKQIRYFSSGMKQRLKLAQAIFSDTPVVLLDEPCTNLDEAGIELYHHLIKNYCHNRLVIVSSNDKIEYNFCNENVLVSDYKK